MLNRTLEMYDEGSIATREAAQRVLGHTTTENKEHVLNELDCRPELYFAVMELVKEWKDLSDEMWATMKTCEPGAYTRPFTDQEIAERDKRHKQEHKDMRRGIEVLSGEANETPIHSR